MGSPRAVWNVAWGVVLLPLLVGTAEAAPRWAVLSSGSVQRSGLGNLLTVRLSELDGIELVERDEVEKVLREQELGALVESAAMGRGREIARLLRAQRLLVIDGGWTQSLAKLRVVIDDTTIGARLFDERLEVATPDPEKMCSTVISLLEDSMRRFPEGIRSAIAVPFFVSKGLEKQYDSLQQEYAKVVSQSLMRAPGIAIVNLDELQHIRAELALSASEINRVVPLQVNGEFTVLPASKAETPRCHLTVTISDGASTLETIDHRSIELTQVRELLVGSVTERILAKIGDESIQPMSMAEQEAALAARADRFLEYGAFRLAIKLREAILLLNPGNVEQRLALLSNHDASHPFGDLPYTFPHVEYLLKNRLLMLPQAQRLIPRRDYYFPPKPSSLPPHLNDDYVYAITLAKLAADLSYDPEDIPEAPFKQVVSELMNEARQRHAFIAFAARLVLKPANDWNHARKLKDLSEVLSRVPDFGGLFPLLPEIVTSERFSEKEVTEFCNVLRATKRPGPVHLADYLEVLLKIGRHPDRIAGSDVAVIENLEKLTIEPPRSRNAMSYNQYGLIARELRKLRSRLSRLVQQNEAKADGELRTVLVTPQFPPPRFETVHEAITVEEIADWGYSQSRMYYSNGVQPGCAPLDCRIVQHTENADVAWNAAEIQSLSRNSEGKLTFHKVFQPSLGELSVRNGLAILRVRSDGKYLWVATVSGVFMIDGQGEVLAHFTSADGLPGYSSWQSELTERRGDNLPRMLPDGEKYGSLLGGRLVGNAGQEFRGQLFYDRANPRSEEKGQRIAFLSVFPISPGRCLAVGRYGPQQTTWIATLDWNPSEDRKEVRVLHRAERVLPPEQYANQELLQAPEQVDLAFSIPWICLDRDCEDGTPVVVIGRNHDTRSGWPIENTPLAIDLETSAVTTLAERIPGLADVRGGTDAECVGGSLILADRGKLTAFVRQDDGTVVREVIAAERTQHHALVRLGDAVYSPGRTWYRMTFADGFKSQLLARETRIGGEDLDGFAPSANFGIWARSWRDSRTACRVDPDTPHTTTMSPLARCMSWEGWFMRRPIIERIRSLGGSVEISSEISRPQLFKGHLMGQLSGIAMCLTRQWRGGDDGLKDLADLGIINALFLIDADVTDKGIRWLRYAPRNLYLANTRITTEGLEKLDFSMTHAIWLEDRTGQFLNDETLELLENVKGLNYLALVGPGFTEKSRQHLAKLKGLKDARLVREEGMTDLLATGVANPVTEPPETLITWEQGVDIRPIAAWTRLESFPRGVHLEGHQDDSDLVWDDHGVHLLSRGGNDKLALKTIFSVGRRGSASSLEKVSRARSDGENLWVVTNDQIVVVSESGKTLAEFTKETGLPSYTSVHRILPQTTDAIGVLPNNGVKIHDLKCSWSNMKDSGEPWSTLRDFQELPSGIRSSTVASVLSLGGGKCLAVGRTGVFGRTWIALLSLDGGKPSVRVLHTATRMLKPDGYGDPEMLAAPEQLNVVFQIPWACFYSDPRRPDKRFVLFGRVHDARVGTVSNTPVAVDLESFEVTTLAQQIPGLSEVRGGAVGRCVQGALVLNDWGRLEVFSPHGENGFAKTTIADDRTQNLFLVEHAGSVYSPGHTWYRIGPRRSRQPSSAASRFPTVVHELNGELCVEAVSRETLPAQNELERYASSSLFGIWAMRKDGRGAYRIDPERPSRREVSPFAKFVPEQHLKRHETAVQAIRDLGGFVDRSDRCRQLDEPRRRMAPGSTVVCLTEQWRGEDEGLRHLCDLYGPVHLFLLSTPVTDEGMKRLAGIDELRGLVLSETPITAEGLGRLPLKQLSSVYLRGKPGGVDYSDDVISVFTNCYFLRTMTLCGKGFTEESVPLLKRIPCLGAVRVEGTSIPERCRDLPGAPRFSGNLVPDELVVQKAAEQESGPSKSSRLPVGEELSSGPLGP